MARRIDNSNDSLAAAPKFGLVVGTALVSMALAGCASTAPAAETSFAKAQAALEDGRTDRAIAHAEAAVLSEPRNAGYRAVLGAAYLKTGRFESAATAFGDAIDLGDEDARTILSYALAKVATGNNNAALAKLTEYQGVIPSADLGLALALAGQPERGVHHLINAVRNGDASSKARQNLAYSYALAGNWRAARVMAAEDVPADQLDARLSDWAASARPEDYQVRVASLLGVSVAPDNGQPQHLAIANFPAQSTLVAEAAAGGDQTPVEAPVVAPSASENTRVASRSQSATPTPKPANTISEPVSSATPAAATPSRSAPRFVSNAVVQDVPAATAPATRSPAPQRRQAVASGSVDTHLVQLGAFSTRAVAESKWDEMKRRFPALAGHDVVITEARVNGRTFFRVAAAGFGRRSAAKLCNTVKARGNGCFAYAAANPPAGAVDRGVRIAARTR